MIEQKKQWLLGVSWDSIVTLNRTLCQAQKLEPLANDRTIKKAQKSWEQNAPQSMTLFEAMKICRTAFEYRPFTYNNGNTFAAIGRGLIEDYLRDAPSVESQILRTTVSHYVAGRIERKELEQVLRQLSSVMTQTPAPTPRPPTATEVATPGLAQARPVT